MDEEEFRKFLKRSGRKPSVADKNVRLVRDYEVFLHKFREEKNLDQVTSADLEAFTHWLEEQCGKSAKPHLHAISYYYRFKSNDVMRRRAAELREQRIAKKRKSFRLRDFYGVKRHQVMRLEKIKIRNVEQMLEQGRTRKQREELAKRTGLPIEAIEEFVKLSDLSRIPGVKGVRARLYLDAGVDTVGKMAQWDSDELRAMCIEFVEKTGFKGIAPLPKEAKFTVETARKLPKLIDY